MPVSGQVNIGSYRLLNLVRAGKTCQIWEVMHDAKGQRFALKLLLSEHRNNAQEVGLLKREFTIGRGLSHANVIKIYDLGQDAENLWVAMEYFPAPNLKQLIQQNVAALQPLALKIIDRAAAGLSYLHEQGWVHRDIKPDNFLIDAAGDVRLIDFALGQKPPGFFGRLFGGKSKVQGTRSYMSPEQIRGKPVDQRADIYSFGCTVHELLGGKPPFTGSTTTELLNKHLKSAPPPIEAANRNVTPQMSALIKKMLAKEPKDRPQSMVDVLRDLKSLKVFKTTPKQVAEGSH